MFAISSLRIERSLRVPTTVYRNVSSVGELVFFFKGTKYINFYFDKLSIIMMIIIVIIVMANTTFSKFK